MIHRQSGYWRPVIEEVATDRGGEVGIPRNQVAAATVFRTGKFVSETKALRDAAAPLPDPIPYDLSLLKDYESDYISEERWCW